MLRSTAARIALTIVCVGSACQGGRIGAPVDGGPDGDPAGSGGEAGMGGTGGGSGNGGTGGGTGGMAGTASGSGGSAGGDNPMTSGCSLIWSSGFEEGFPGEWLSYDNGSWSANGTMPDGRTEAWTIISQGEGPVLSGSHAYKGWLDGTEPDVHRAYPVLHADFPSPIVNTFWVYLEADYDAMSEIDWIGFGTWGNGHPDKFALHTLAVRDRRIEFAHTNPRSGEYIGPMPRTDFPLGRWVRFTAYVYYEETTGFVQVWQDGVPMLRAEVSLLEMYPGNRHQRFHWGLYTAGAIAGATLYNDDMGIWTLPAPLDATNLDHEPDCYLRGT